VAFGDWELPAMLRGLPDAPGVVGEIRAERVETVRVVGTRTTAATITDVPVGVDGGAAVRLWRAGRRHDRHAALPGAAPDRFVELRRDALAEPGTRTPIVPTLPATRHRESDDIAPLVARVDRLADTVQSILDWRPPAHGRLLVQARRRTRWVCLVNTAGAQLCWIDRGHTSIELTVGVAGRESTRGLAYPDGVDLDELRRVVDDLAAEVTRDRAAAPRGRYRIICDPEFTGLLMHELVGHALEADVAATDALAPGRVVAPPCLTVVDDPTIGPTRYAFDDEGTPARPVTLVAEGVVGARLHSATTAALDGTMSTGHARAVDWRNPPIVRMSTIHAAAGTVSREALFDQVGTGLYLCGARGGGRTDTFTACARDARLVADGRPGSSVGPALMIGSPAQILASVRAAGTDLAVHAGGEGGCGKAGQFPLAVAAGGPSLVLTDVWVDL
jgi:predicted Zn-dependent protease